MPDGPAVSSTYALGYFKEDYEYINSTDPEVLDVHNGRFCVTPEYPSGIYCYFATVDSNWNSAYPYVVGPTFYGVKTAQKVTSVTESTTTYIPTSTSISQEAFDQLNINIFPNPASDLIAVQINGLLKDDLSVRLFDMTGRKIESKIISKGQTIAFFETESLYDGTYLIVIENGNNRMTKKVVVKH